MKYLLTVRVPFEVLDDIVAREKIEAILKDSGSLLGNEGAIVKLQRMKENSQPEKVNFSLDNVL